MLKTRLVSGARGAIRFLFSEPESASLGPRPLLHVEIVVSITREKKHTQVKNGLKVGG
jgi:hypothetical protein